MRRASLIAVLALLAAGCGDGPTSGAVVEGADAERGAELIEEYGCGSCHTIGGIEGADANVGPPLTDFRENRNLAGQIPNTPENAVRWIMDPQEIEPDTIMPDLGVSEAEARDIVGYLYDR